MHPRAEEERLSATVADRKERVFRLLRRFIATVKSGLRAGQEPRRALWGGVDRYDLSVVGLSRTLPVPQPECTRGLRLRRDLVLGTGEGSPGPLPTQAARLVAYGVKPACVLHGTEAALARVCDAAYRQGLVALLSPAERVPLNEKCKDGFSNVAAEVRPARPGAGGLRELILAKDVRHALLAWVGLTYGWDAVLGTALGYPRCCIDHFTATWERVSVSHQGDPAELLLETGQPGPFDWRVNIFGRYLGLKVIDHFPCSWRCEASQRLAEDYLQALGRHEPHAPGLLRTALNCPYVWTRGDGVLAFPQANVRPTPSGWAIAYDAESVLCTYPSNSSLYDAVRSASTLVASGTSVRVAGRRFDARVALFGDRCEGFPDRGAGTGDVPCVTPGVPG